MHFPHTTTKQNRFVMSTKILEPIQAYFKNWFMNFKITVDLLYITNFVKNSIRPETSNLTNFPNERSSHNKEKLSIFLRLSFSTDTHNNTGNTRCFPSQFFCLQNTKIKTNTEENVNKHTVFP